MGTLSPPSAWTMLHLLLCSSLLALAPTLPLCLLLLVPSLTLLWSRVLWALPPRLSTKLRPTPWLLDITAFLLSVTTARDLLMPPSWLEPPESSLLPLLSSTTPPYSLTSPTPPTLSPMLATLLTLWPIMASQSLLPLPLLMRPWLLRGGREKLTLRSFLVVFPTLVSPTLVLLLELSLTFPLSRMLKYLPLKLATK